MLFRLAILLFISLIFPEINYSQQTILSIQNGDFSNTLSWDCTCIPQDGDSLIINHSIILDQDLNMNSGQILINQSGYLTADNTTRKVSIVHACLINYGGIHIGNLLLDSASISSVAPIVIDDDFMQYDNFPITIDGNLTVHDTLFLTNVSWLNCNGYLSANIISLDGTLILNNSGECNAMENYDDFELMGVGNEFTIRGDLILDGGSFIILDASQVNIQNNIYNVGILYLNEGAILQVNNSFYNGDTISPNGDLISIQGKIIVKNDFINQHFAQVGGCFSVGNYSANHEYFFGNVDFCDATGGVFDLNTGTISPNVTYCTLPCKQEEETNGDLLIFPNPFQDILNISLGQSGASSIEMINTLGQIVLNQSIVNLTEIKVNHLKSGFYYYFLKNNDLIIQSGKLLKN